MIMNRQKFCTSMFLASAFLSVVGSRLWLVAVNGSDVPFWDQWNAEGDLLYKVLLEHGYRAAAWFSAHNEHRIFTTRATDALLFAIDGQWDPLVQVSWNAVCAGLIAVVLCRWCLRLVIDPRYALIACVLAILGCAAPYSWENTLAGFQTQFFYAILLGLALFEVAAEKGLATPTRFTLVIFLAVLSLLTLATGALVCLAAAAAGIAGLAIVRQRPALRDAGLIAVLLALGAIGYVITPVIARHAVLRPTSIGAAWHAFDLTVGWPSRLGVLVWIPSILWVSNLFRARRVGRNDLVLLALAAFVVLNALAVAAARGGEATNVASRYTDIVWLTWLVNALALMLLAQTLVGGLTKRLITAASLGFVVPAAYLLIMAGTAAMPWANARGGQYALESANVRAYVVQHDPSALVGKPMLELPFPQAELLKGYLDDQTIRSILPPGIRPGVIGRSAATDADILASGLVLTGVPYGSPPAPAPVNGYFWGTWSKDGDAHRARFASPVVVARGRTVRLRVSGYLGHPGTALYLEAADGSRRVDLVPRSVAGWHWLDVEARIPADNYRLVAIDETAAPEGWFAFTDPIEIGRLRPFAEWLIRHGAAFAILGMVSSLLLAIFGLQRSVARPER